MAPDIVASIAARLAAHAGLEVPLWVVEARAAARMAVLDMQPPSYLAFITSPRGGKELAALVEAVRVGETRLFRHRQQIATLVDAVVPAIRARAAARVVRVWSAGCSAGEEPYTLAAVLASALRGFSIKITATDVSHDALAMAANAEYSATGLDGVPSEWAAAFVRDGDRVRVRPEVQALVKFEQGNLVDPPRSNEIGRYDVVWCRNVLIYFTAAARKRVIQRLVNATVPGGHIFVGYSESLRDIAELEAMRDGEVVYYMRRDPSAPALDRRTPVAGVPPMSRGSTPALGVPITNVPGVSARSRDSDARDPAPSKDRDRDSSPGIKDPSASSSSWDLRTPPPTRIPESPPPDDVLAVIGRTDTRAITAELTSRLGIEGLRRLVVDLDAADMLGDDLATVLRRARAAAQAAGVELIVRATKTGARRWLARHGLDLDARTEDAP